MTNIWQKLYTLADDSLNPIAVKELRQAARGHFLLGILLLFLVIQLAIVGFPLAGLEHETDFHLGKNLFLTLFGFLLGTCMLVIPGYTGYRMSQERTDRDMDLLFVTTLTPNSIILGKFLASMIVAVLIYSTVLPFMTLTYFLRGIDLPTIILFFFLGLVGTALAIQIALLGACIPIQNQARLLVLFLLIGTLSSLMGGMVGLCEDLMRSGVGARLFEGETLLQIGLWFLLTLLAIFFCHHLSVAFISPPAANKSYPVRKNITVSWLITLVLAAATCQYTRNNSSLELWFAFWGMLLGVGFFFVVCERDYYGSRVLSEAPTGPLRALAFFFFTGAGAGVAWVSAMIVLTFLAGGFVHGLLGIGSLRGIMYDGGLILGGCLLYSYCYNLTAVFIRRMFLRSHVSPENTWGVTLVLIVIGFTLAPIASIMVTGRGDSSIALMLNPFMALNDRRLRDGALLFSIAWGVVASLGLFLWFTRQFDEFMRRRPISNGKTS
jgi:hypothetical protein